MQISTMGGGDMGEAEARAADLMRAMYRTEEQIRAGAGAAERRAAERQEDDEREDFRRALRAMERDGRGAEAYRLISEVFRGQPITRTMGGAGAYYGRA